MTFQKNLTTLIVLLVIIFAAIGVLSSYKFENTSSLNTGNDNNSLIVIYSDVKIPTSRTIVTNQYLKNIPSDSKVVVAGTDGSLNYVRKGSVLTGGNVITVDTGSTSVYNIKNPEESVKSN